MSNYRIHYLLQVPEERRLQIGHVGMQRYSFLIKSSPSAIKPLKVLAIFIFQFARNFARLMFVWRLVLEFELFFCNIVSIFYFERAFRLFKAKFYAQS